MANLAEPQSIGAYEKTLFFFSHGLPSPRETVVIAPSGFDPVSAELRGNLAASVGLDLKIASEPGTHWTGQEIRLLVLPEFENSAEYQAVLARALFSEATAGSSIYIAFGVLARLGIRWTQEGQIVADALVDGYLRELPPDLQPAQIVLGTAGLVMQDDTTFIMPSFGPATAPNTKGSSAPPDAQTAAPPDARRATGLSFNNDHPAATLEEDLLNRKAIAQAMAHNVRRAWDDDQKRPFIVHLAGRWGSGKSTILNLMGHYLKTPSDGEKTDTDVNGEEWFVINFNAWRMQQDGHPWWSLLNTVAFQAPSQITGAFQRIRFRYWNWRWRVTALYRTLLIGFLITLAALAFFLLTSSPPEPGRLEPGQTRTETEVRTSQLPERQGENPAPPGILTDTLTTKTEGKRAPGLLDRVSGLGERITFLIALITGFGTLLVRRQKTETTLKELSLDPTEPLRRRYTQMIARLERPVAVFIDDLDRCDATYVVELMQAAQNLYGDVPVLYVVASDKDWLVSAYEQTYAPFIEHVSRPGRPLGHLFVEKIFQLSVNVPELSEQERDSYLGELVGADVPDDTNTIDAIAALAKAQQQIEQSEGDLETIRTAVSETRLLPSAKDIQTQAFQAIQSQKAEASINHYLQDYKHLMDPNPRSIKRVINAFQFLQGYAFLAGKDLRVEALALWAILDLRFPYVTRRLHRDPLRWSPDDAENINTSPVIGTILDLLEMEEIETLRRFG